MTDSSGTSNLRLAEDRTQLHGALYRVALELSGCPAECSHDFHRLAVASGLKIAKDALARVMPAPANHEEAQATIAEAVRRIEIIADTFGYDPQEWLAESPAETILNVAPPSVSGSRVGDKSPSEGSIPSGAASYMGMDEPKFRDWEELYMPCKAEVGNWKAVTISQCQRVHKIGYNRAARIMEALEAFGVLKRDRMTRNFSVNQFPKP